MRTAIELFFCYKSAIPKHPCNYIISEMKYFLLRFHKKITSYCPQVQGTFSEKTQLIWLCAPPVSVEVWGGLMVEGMEFQRRSMRYILITVITSQS